LLCSLFCFSAAFRSGVVEFRPAAFELILFYFLLPVPLFFLLRNRWKEGVTLLLAAANLIMWQVFFVPAAVVSPAFLSINLGRDLSFLCSSGMESIQVDAGGSRGKPHASGDRRRGSDFFPLRRLSSFIHPIRLCSGFPHRTISFRLILSLFFLLLLWLGLAHRVVRLWSRRQSVLIASGTGNLRRDPLFSADTAVLWIYRFGLERSSGSLPRGLSMHGPDIA